jgi:hypothetical protein
MGKNIIKILPILNRMIGAVSMGYCQVKLPLRFV